MTTIPHSLLQENIDTETMYVLQEIYNNLNILCDEDEKLISYVLQWLAYPIQNPGAKLPTGLLVMSSIPGIGKSIVINKMMAAVYGDNFMPLTSHRVEANFNSWAEKALYCCIDDCGPAVWQLADEIKAYLTEASIRVEIKAKDSRTVKNRMNFAITTNTNGPNSWDDVYQRRFVVIGTEHSRLKGTCDFPFLAKVISNNPELCTRAFQSVFCDPNFLKMAAPDSAMKTKLLDN